MDFSQSVIFNNFRGKKGTFIYALHEESCFDSVFFRHLCSAAREQVDKIKNRPSEELYIVIMLYHVYINIIKYLKYNVDPNDEYFINNFDSDVEESVVEELECIFESRWLIERLKGIVKTTENNGQA